MSTLVISNVSAYAVLVLLDEKASQVLGWDHWTSDESKDISGQYTSRLEKLFSAVGSKLGPSSLSTILSTIVVVNGPGTFTGLRNSMSFAIGLGHSLKIPVRTLPV